MTSVMRPSLSLTQVYLYRQPIDFRKSYRGLSAIIECELGQNPFSGCLYAFTNKQQNKIKFPLPKGIDSDKKTGTDPEKRPNTHAGQPRHADD